MIPAMGAGDALTTLIERGGIVMIPLLALSVLSLALVFERSWFWWQTSRGGARRRFTRLIEFLRTGDTRAESLLASDNSIYAAVARAVTGPTISDAAAITAVETQRPRMERFMTTLSTIITAAPLLGILGTVLGIIQSFELLGAEETLTDPRTVSAGIAEALLTTAAGLVVALFTLFPYMIFRGQLDRALGRMEAIIAAAHEGAALRVASETARAADRTRVPVEDLAGAGSEPAARAAQVGQRSR